MCIDSGYSCANVDPPAQVCTSTATPGVVFDWFSCSWGSGNGAIDMTMPATFTEVIPTTTTSTATGTQAFNFLTTTATDTGTVTTSITSVLTYSAYEIQANMVEIRWQSSDRLSTVSSTTEHQSTGFETVEHQSTLLTSSERPSTVFTTTEHESTLFLTPISTLQPGPSSPITRSRDHSILSNGDKAAIGVAVPILVIAILAVPLLLWLRKRRARRRAEVPEISTSASDMHQTRHSARSTATAPPQYRAYSPDVRKDDKDVAEPAEIAGDAVNPAHELDDSGRAELGSDGRTDDSCNEVLL